MSMRDGVRRGWLQMQILADNFVDSESRRHFKLDDCHRINESIKGFWSCTTSVTGVHWVIVRLASSEYVFQYKDCRRPRVITRLQAEEANVKWRTPFKQFKLTC